MGGEVEGFSIPAQRVACLRKAESLGAVVEEEFVDRGESAKTANRPELMNMLHYLRKHAVQYVIVHKVDRLAVAVPTTLRSPWKSKTAAPPWCPARRTSTRLRAAFCFTAS